MRIKTKKRRDLKGNKGEEDKTRDTCNIGKKEENNEMKKFCAWKKKMWRCEHRGRAGNIQVCTGKGTRMNQVRRERERERI